MNVKSITMFQVDAFTDKCFGGNPAAVCILDDCLTTEAMQNIAAENNLSETAFVHYKKGIYNIRYFTPTTEVDLCGHATLASAFVVFRAADDETAELLFRTKRKIDLRISKEKNAISMLFPKDAILAIPGNDKLSKALGKVPKEVYRGNSDYMAVFEDQDTIDAISPDFRALLELDMRGIIITAPGKDVDFVSRFFAPKAGIDEDPVTGSAHTTLIPYWANQLNRNNLVAQQRSKRGGKLYCENLDQHVKIKGNAVLYMQAEIYLQCSKEMHA